MATCVCVCNVQLRWHLNKLLVISVTSGCTSIFPFILKNNQGLLNRALFEQNSKFGQTSRTSVKFQIPSPAKRHFRIDHSRCSISCLDTKDLSVADPFNCCLVDGVDDLSVEAYM
jgi:hypothetical protein